MTQSQTHQQYLASLKFYSLSSICRWAGLLASESSISFLDNDRELPYVKRNDVWYYFGLYPEREFRLVCTAMKDLGEQDANQS